MSTGPLSILQTSKASTAIPLIADGTMARFRVNALSVDAPDGNRTWPQIKIDARTLDPVPTTEGNTLNPGYPVFVTFPLGTKDNPGVPPDWTAPAVAKFQDAILGTGDEGNRKNKPTRPDFDAESLPTYIGKEFVAKVKVKKPKDDQYSDSNVLTNYTYPGDISA